MVLILDSALPGSPQVAAAHSIGAVAAVYAASPGGPRPRCTGGSRVSHRARPMRAHAPANSPSATPQPAPRAPLEHRPDLPVVVGGHGRRRNRTTSKSIGGGPCFFASRRKKGFFERVVVRSPS